MYVFVKSCKCYKCQLDMCVFIKDLSALMCISKLNNHALFFIIAGVCSFTFGIFHINQLHLYQWEKGGAIYQGNPFKIYLM